MNKVLSGLQEGWWMFFDTFWALIFGFALSGLIQTFVTRKQMSSLLGTHTPTSVARSSFFGMVSSSCSYAASALAHSIFKKGADFTASMVFMFASTNLVIELGIVLWLLIGWQFAVAEFVGGAFMIVMIALIVPKFIDSELLRSQLNSQDQKENDDHHDSHITSAAHNNSSASSNSALTPVSVNGASYSMAIEPAHPGSEPEENGESFGLRSKLSSSAGFTMGDFIMLRFELLIGFIVAGLAISLIPFSWWRSLFISGHGIWSAIENAIIGPVLACISFVCSVGNVPLAAALWSAGITFGGVVSFIFADLLSMPLILIYRKYYGVKTTTKLVFIFWAIISVSGILTEVVFSLLKKIPSRHTMVMGSKHFGYNATTILNAIALLLFVAIYYLYKNPPAASTAEGSEFAQDPICGMQVRKSDAPARLQHQGVEYFFCMEGCKESFAKKLIESS